MEGSKQIKDDVSHFTSLFEKKKLADANDKKKNSHVCLSNFQTRHGWEYVVSTQSPRGLFEQEMSKEPSNRLIMSSGFV